MNFSKSGYIIILKKEDIPPKFCFPITSLRNFHAPISITKWPNDQPSLAGGIIIISCDHLWFVEEKKLYPTCRYIVFLIFK